MRVLKWSASIIALLIAAMWAYLSYVLACVLLGRQTAPDFDAIEACWEQPC